MFHSYQYQILVSLEFKTYVQQVQDERIFEAFVQLHVLILKYVLHKYHQSYFVHMQ